MYYPLVSVIIPVYNVKKYLVEAVSSVISQTYRNLEIVIVDDGSTDGSEKLCDEYAGKESRIRLIHQKNRGLSGARNAGLDIASGEIIAFLDSDDAFHPEMIQHMVNVMYKQDADVVMCQFEKCRTDGSMSNNEGCLKIESKQIEYDHDNALRALLENKIDNYVWNKVYKRSCFETIRFPEGHVYEDVDTTFRVINRARRVIVIGEALVFYRRWKGSLTGVYSVNTARDRERAYAHVASFVRENTPTVFNVTHEQMLIQIQLRVNLGLFCKSDDESRLYCETIAKLGKNLNLQECDFRTRAMYKVFCFSPCVFKRIYLTIENGLKIIRELQLSTTTYRFMR